MSEAQQQINDVPSLRASFTQADEEMLLGTMRDFMLEGIRPAIGWAKLKEKQQHAVNNAVEQACRQAIRGAAPVIAGRGFGTIVTTVGDINTKGELVIAKLSAERTRDNILGLAEAGRCTLVLVDPEVFMNAKPAAVMKDQPDLMDQETSEQKATREEIDRDAAEYEASVARAKQIKPTDTASVGTAEAEVVGSLLSPKIKDAADRGRAYAEAGGAGTVPKDLEGKPEEVGAWLKGYDSVAHAGGAAAAEAPKKRRGRKSTEERVAERAHEVADA